MRKSVLYVNDTYYDKSISERPNLALRYQEWDINHKMIKHRFKYNSQVFRIKRIRIMWLKK